MTETTTTARDDYEHARSNAKGWYEELRDLYREAHNDEVTDDRKEAIRQELDEKPLSVEVRSPWYSPAQLVPKPAEYNILLATGGPALRVWGELDNYSQPDSAELQMQDWGVPWREVWPCEVEEMDEARAVLLWFATTFYFGE